MTCYPQILPVRKQDELILKFLRKRLDTILPEAMHKAGLDMWLVLCQEDNPDPVFQTMIPMNTWTPILQILIFFDRGPGKGVERINLSMTNLLDLYDKPWNGVHSEEQWALLPQIIAERDPKTIGINIGQVQWAAGGLTHNLYRQLLAVLPENYAGRLVSAEPACNHWLMSLCAEELEIYPHICALTHRIIANCYSRAHIIPGTTTTDDLEWDFWQISSDLGLGLSFKPFFNLVRSQDQAQQFPLDDKVIRRGDLIHCDVGNRYLRLCSDMQQWAYIRRDGESDAPAGLKRLLSEVHRLQKVYMDEFKLGLSGNQMLHNMLERARRAGIPGAKIYSHSLGLYLHQPGPLIGLPWEQENNPGRGDVALEYNTVFTMELCIENEVPEWDGQKVRLSCEEDVSFTRTGCQPIDGIQSEFYLV